jgi:hypothetical protein
MLVTRVQLLGETRAPATTLWRNDIEQQQQMGMTQAYLVSVSFHRQGSHPGLASHSISLALSS